MGHEVVSSVVTWALTAVLGAVAGWAVSAVRAASRRRDEEERQRAQQMEALCGGMRSLLRVELVRAHRKYVNDGLPVELDDREYVERTYQSYHALGGNGLGTRMYEEIMRCGRNLNE